MAINKSLLLLIIISLCLSEVNNTDILEKSLNQIKDEFNDKLKSNFIKVNIIYEKRIEDIMNEFSEIREDLKSMKESRDKRDFDRINENWVNYKEEKNFLLIKKLVNQKNAEEVCKALEESTDSSVTLATIESKDEQNFINKYLYEELAIIENVWIGVTKHELKNEFIIRDKNYVKFTNWANGSPSYSSDKKCIQLKSPFMSNKVNFKDVLNGFWEDVSCDYNNWILCERTQYWSLIRVRREIFDLKLKIDNACMIPIGFIYSQLPSQPEPQTIWPNFNWTDISSQYSGLFFRVLGNNSMSFGETQEENSPRLTSARSVGCGTNYKHQQDILSNDQYSENVWSGGSYGGAAHYHAMNFKVSSGEVRPRNQAIRIWQRIH